MDFLTVYILFAVTTALAALYELYWPVIKNLRQNNPEGMISKNWKTALIALVVGGMVLAPLLVFSTIIPSYSNRFRNALYSSLIVH